MSKIHILNQDTINKIAAGEVIERPMAVVKELIENAIDAGAGSITVEVKDGGKSLIRLTDNGSGMEEEDIRLAFTPHATSKIASAEDLTSVSTLGFRGEALASIASVSQLEMVTKTREALMGHRYLVDGGEEKSLESVGCPEGTTFLVRNLFYNTPARLKFLKTSPTEAGYINTLIERLALSHPDISFRFINQNQPKLQTSGNGNLKDVIYHIYGREITSNVIPVDSSEVSCRVEGFVGKPVISRGNRNFMNYFINGRYIKSSTIHKAIEDAYQPYSMQHRYPFTVLHFTVDTRMVDINVHPQKMEIRFTDAQGIYQSIYHAVSEALKHREFIPEVTVSEDTAAGKKAAAGVGVSGGRTASPKPVRAPEPFEKKRSDSMRVLEELKKQNDILDQFPDALPGPDYILGKELEQVRETAAYGTKAEAAYKDGQDHSGAPRSESPDRPAAASKEGSTEASQQQAGRMDHPTAAADSQTASAARQAVSPGIAETVAKTLEKPEQESIFDRGILSEQAQREICIIGQVFDTFWILQYEDAMYLVDQHAAHEKVLYERFMKQLAQKKPMTQLLQPPVILTLSMPEEQAVTEHREVFEGLGYQLEPFGGREYAVTGVPAHLPKVDDAELLKEVIDTLVDNHVHATPELLMDKVASMSCKAAVKGNNKLPREQMEELLRELMHLENPYHCPHGRPTMIKMTKTEMEKKFKRIV